ncbi:MAG: tetratricopeptide repeat-containing protein, partial [uncultured bacterium]
MKVAKFCGTIFACLLVLITVGAPAADDIELDIESGKALLQTGNFKRSAELFNRTLTQKKEELKDHPRHAEAWYLFSVSLRKLGRTDLADKALDRAKKLRELSQATKATPPGENIATETDFSATVSEVPVDSQPVKDAAPDNKPAVNTTTDNKPDKQTPPDKQPASEPAKDKNQNTGSAAQAVDLASLKNERAKTAYQKAMTHLEAGQTQKAADELLLAVDAEPGNIELLGKTAEIVDQIGSSYYQKSIRVYKELDKVSSGKLSVKQQTAWVRACIFASKPDLTLAETILFPLLKKDPENVELLVLSAQLDTENKKYQLAVASYERVIKLDASNMTAYLGLGDVYQRMNQFPKAIEILQKARAMWPDSFMPLVSLGKAYLKNGNNGFALVMFNLAYEMNPESFDVNLAMLEILAQGADYRANLHLAKCESIVRGDPRVEFWKAVFLELDEYPAKAIQIYSLLALYE